MQQDLFLFIFWIAVAVFIVVQALLIFAVIRFRQRPGHERDIPVQTHGNTPLEIGWTIAPALIVVAIAVPTIQNIGGTYDPPSSLLASEQSMTVEVIGHQWWWEFRYIDPVTGEVDFVTANEMHIPVNAVVNLRLTSEDVIHSFGVPNLAGTRDAVPGRINRMWFRATETGTFLGFCRELCGLSHAQMRFIVVAETPEGYQAWAEGQRSPVTLTAEQQAGYETFRAKGCFACHTIGGTDAQGTVGPELTHFGSRMTIAARALHKGDPSMDIATFLETPGTPRDPAHTNLKTWLRNPPAVKPGSLMPNLNLTEAELDSLAAFLESLD